MVAYKILVSFLLLNGAFIATITPSIAFRSGNRKSTQILPGRPNKNYLNDFEEHNEFTVFSDQLDALIKKQPTLEGIELLLPVAKMKLFPSSEEVEWLPLLKEAELLLEEHQMLKEVENAERAQRQAMAQSKKIEDFALQKSYWPRWHFVQNRYYKPKKEQWPRTSSYFLRWFNLENIYHTSCNYFNSWNNDQHSKGNTWHGERTKKNVAQYPIERPNEVPSENQEQSVADKKFTQNEIDYLRKLVS